MGEGLPEDHEIRVVGVGEHFDGFTAVPGPGLNEGALKQFEEFRALALLAGKSYVDRLRHLIAPSACVESG